MFNLLKRILGGIGSSVGKLGATISGPVHANPQPYLPPTPYGGAGPGGTQPAVLPRVRPIPTPNTQTFPQLSDTSVIAGQPLPGASLQDINRLIQTGAGGTQGQPQTFQPQSTQLQQTVQQPTFQPSGDQLFPAGSTAPSIQSSGSTGATGGQSAGIGGPSSGLNTPLGTLSYGNTTDLTQAQLDEQRRLQEEQRQKSLINTEAVAGGVDPFNLSGQSTGSLEKLLATLESQFSQAQQNQPSAIDLLKQSRTEAGVDDIAGSLLGVQNQLNQKQGSLEAGLNQIEDQPIPMPLIIGQQASLQRQGQAELANLTRREQTLSDAYSRSLGLSEQNFAARQADITKKEELPGKYLDFVTKAFGVKKTEAEIAALQNPTRKQEIDTVFNLAQTYPDAGILPTDSLAVAQNKASQAPSFEARNTNLGAIANPLTGDIIFYDKKGNVVNRATGQPTGGNVGGGNTGGGNVSQLPAQLQSSVSTVGNVQFIDESKLADANQKKIAQGYAARLGIPYIDEQSAQKIKESVTSLGSAQSLLGTISSLSERAITAKNLQQVAGQTLLGNVAKIPIIGNLQKDKKLYNAAVDSFLSLLTRAAGEKGVLTNTDVARIKKALPTYDDTTDIAKQKLANLNTVYNSVVSGAFNSYLGIGQGGSQVKEGTTKIYNGATYKVVGGNWVKQ